MLVYSLRCLAVVPKRKKASRLAVTGGTKSKASEMADFKVKFGAVASADFRMLWYLLML